LAETPHDHASKGAFSANLRNKGRPESIERLTSKYQETNWIEERDGKGDAALENRVGNPMNADRGRGVVKMSTTSTMKLSQAAGRETVVQFQNAVFVAKEWGKSSNKKKRNRKTSSLPSEERSSELVRKSPARPASPHRGQNEEA